MSDRIRIVIADDEPHARERIATLLEAEPGAEVVGEARTGAEAVRLVERERPDILFLDVQMPEGDGFDVVRQLEGDRLPIVIFVTAYDEYAVRAFEVHALDYLLKPFDPDRFQASLSRARRTLNGTAEPVEQRLRALVRELAAPRPSWLERIPIKSDGSIRILDIADVEYITAEANYVRLHTPERSYLIRESMSRLEARLDPTRFLRVHRSTIVCVDRIRELEPLFHGEYVIRMRSGARVTSGRTFRDRVQQALGID